MKKVLLTLSCLFLLNIFISCGDDENKAPYQTGPVEIAVPDERGYYHIYESCWIFRLQLAGLDELYSTHGRIIYAGQVNDITEIKNLPTENLHPYFRIGGGYVICPDINVYFRLWIQEDEEGNLIYYIQKFWPKNYDHDNDIV